MQLQRSLALAEKKADSDVAKALHNLSAALEAALPLLRGDTNNETQSDNVGDLSGSISATQFLQHCAQMPSDLDATYLANTIWEACKLDDLNQLQGKLFDVLGASDQAINFLTYIMANASDIAKISQEDLQQQASETPIGETFVDVEEERRQLLLREAISAMQIAEVARLEVEAIQERTGAATHSVTRSSHILAKKQADKAQKRAAQAVQRAKEAGAILDESELLQVDTALGRGAGGLMRHTPEEMNSLLQGLLPDGSRSYYDAKGLPHGTVFESHEGYDNVIIPASPRDESTLHERLRITDILDVNSQVAFGEKTLNPMQSTVFDVAFHGRENMLICAPTGAGKTNVAMLTLVAHFRDVGLIGESRIESVETGKKVVYIAPMKALAQEVVEKFSSKLKPLKLIVRELTGDMQLTRAEADSAHVIVTTPEKWDGE
jgi:replicative superfamily II helicase